MLYFIKQFYGKLLQISNASEVLSKIHTKTAARVETINPNFMGTESPFIAHRGSHIVQVKYDNMKVHANSAIKA